MDRQSLQALNTLHPDFRATAIKAVSEAQAAMPAGVQIEVIDGERSIAQSNAMSMEARTGPKAAPGGKSYHNYGLAFDVILLQNGKEIKQVNAAWLLMVTIMKLHGLSWGGDFKTNYDPGHFEMHYGYTWQQLYQKYQSGDFIPGTQYVNIGSGVRSIPRPFLIAAAVIGVIVIVKFVF